MQDVKNRKIPESSWPDISKFRRPLLFILLAAIVVIPVSILFLKKGSQALSTNKAAPPAPVAVSNPQELFPMGCTLLKEAKEKENVLYASAPDGAVLRYTINSRLQNEMQTYLESRQPPYSLFIAIEPSTGKILAINSASTDPNWNIEASYRLFPMASLFKMVTAAAALERGLINPDTEIAYRGRTVSENPKNWDVTSRKGGNRIDVTEAMGRSVNPVYGRIASDLVGKEALSATCDAFGFNRQLFSGIPVQPSQIDVPDSTYNLRLAGSGLYRDLKVSPLHAATITAALANKGVMMSPRLVESVIKDGKESQTDPARKITRIVQPGVADEMTKMLLTTVTTGTSAKAFRTADGRRLNKAMKVAAKTGTLNGDDPVGQHTWFAGYAPADNPRIAVLALIINNDRWRIKASNVGEHALATFFRDEIDQIPVQQVTTARKKPVKKVRVARVNKNKAKNGRHQVSRKKTVRSSHRGKGG